MRRFFRSLGCVLWALPVGLGASYVLLPNVSEPLRYGMFAYCALITFGPHLVYLFFDGRRPFAAVAAFLMGQLFHFMALFLCAAFFFLFYRPLLEAGLILFLLYVGAFLFFQLASAGGGRFCGCQVSGTEPRNSGN